MHLGQISLCDRVGFNLKSDENKARILKQLEDGFDIKIIRRHHERFDAGVHVPLINGNPYMACVRTNGNPCFLYLTRHNFDGQVVLIDKKVQQGYFYPRMILTRLWFDDALFDNTLLDGEMVRDRHGRWAFIINDLLVYRNTPLHSMNLVRRINLVYDLLAHRFRRDDLDIFELQVKKYFPCSELGAMLRDFIPALPYTCRGVYFKPFFIKFRDILLNFDDTLIKKVVRTRYKDVANFLVLPPGGDAAEPQPPPSPMFTTPPPPPPLQHARPPAANSAGASRLFWVRKANLPDVYELYDQPHEAGKAGGEAQTACVPTLQTSRMLRDLFDARGVTDLLSMRCVFHPRFKKWAPVEAATEWRG